MILTIKRRSDWHLKFSVYFNSHFTKCDLRNRFGLGVFPKRNLTVSFMVFFSFVIVVPLTPIPLLYLSDTRFPNRWIVNTISD